MDTTLRRPPTGSPVENPGPDRDDAPDERPTGRVRLRLSSAPSPAMSPLRHGTSPPWHGPPTAVAAAPQRGGPLRRRRGRRGGAVLPTPSSHPAGDRPRRPAPDATVWMALPGWHCRLSPGGIRSRRPDLPPAGPKSSPESPRPEGPSRDGPAPGLSRLESARGARARSTDSWPPRPHRGRPPEPPGPRARRSRPQSSLRAR